MSLMPFSTLLHHQTAIVQELGVYFNSPRYRPMPKDYQWLRDMSTRAEDVMTLCRYLEQDFREREKKE